jgi:hypothetical protein
MRTCVCLVVLAIVVTASLVRGDVVQHHGNGTRDGMFVDPLMTQAAAARTRRDPTFNAPVPGPVYAQPLYVTNGPGGRAAFIVVTEQNIVLTLDASDGSQLWASTLGAPIEVNDPPCGNIYPFGITGTPVVDPDARVIYVAAMITPDDGATRHQQVFAVSLEDGSTLPGWPVDLSGLTTPDGQSSFDSSAQYQRGALLVNAGMLYVPYHGHEGSACPPSHGWVVAVPIADPQNPTAWAVPAQRGGIWAPGGLSTDGSSIFAATGNTVGASTWMGGEAVIRFGAGATFSGDPADFFTPSNWAALDTADLDLGSTGPVLIDVPGAVPSQLVIAIGKNGVIYLLDRNDLGGIGTGDGTVGEGLQSARVATSDGSITAAAAYHTASGSYVVFNSLRSGVGCPGNPGNIVAVRIGASAPPTLTVAWCATHPGQGSPIVTTTDGSSEALVWTVGAGGDNRLRAFDGDTGAEVFSGGGPDEQLSDIRQFQTPIAVGGRIVVACDNELAVFTTGGATLFK